MINKSVSSNYLTHLDLMETSALNELMLGQVFLVGYCFQSLLLSEVLFIHLASGFTIELIFEYKDNGSPIQGISKDYKLKVLKS